MISAAKMFDRKYVNLESYQLIWLDSNSKEENNSANTKISLDDLRKIIDYTKRFYNVEECFDYINKTHDCKTVVVCTDESIVNALSNSQHPNNLLGIYILCENQTDHSKNIRSYTNSDDLLNDLNIFANNKLNLPEFTTDDLYRTWWINFIDILCYIIYPTDSLSKLVTALKEYYKENTNEIAKLTHFELEYRSDNPIFWYTQDTCIYRVLNKALRQHNVELLFLFGFYVQDMFRQLTVGYEHIRLFPENNNFKLKTYRSQIMSKNEIEILKKRTRLYIITNSLFSTTLDRQLALFVLESSSSAQLENDSQSVLFQIEMDLRIASRPYANISQLSHFPQESEVLFAIGTEFEVINVKFSENIWTVDLRLIGISFKYNEEVNRLTTRRCLITCVDKLIRTYKAPSLNEIESIFNGLSKLYPLEKWILAARYHCQAEYQKHIAKDGDTAVSEYHKAIDTWLECNPDNDPELNCWFHIGHIYGSIGSFCYDAIHDKVMTKNIYMMALNYYEKAMTSEIIDDFQRIDILSYLAVTYKSIAIMCDDNHQKSQAYLQAVDYYKLCLNNMLECYSSTNNQFSTYYEQLANIYKSLEDYESAIENYIKALDIELQNIGSAYSRIMSLCEEIIEIDLRFRRNYERQLKYQLIKHEYILKDQSDNVENSEIIYHKKELGESHVALAYIYIKLGQIELGQNHYQQGIDLLQSIGKLDSSEIIIIESINVLE